MSVYSYPLMESFINPEAKEEHGVNKIHKVLIATIFSPDPVLLACNRLGPDRLILLIDKEDNADQLKSLKIIKESLGRVIDVKTVKTAVYDIVEIAAKCVEVIDMQPKEDILYVNITSGRKTKALGLLYACYARSEKVKKIAYNPEEDKNAVVYLPKLCFALTDTQRIVLNAIAEGTYKTHAELAEKLAQSRAMLYKNIRDLHNLDLITTENSFKLTDAGRIARL